MRRRTALPMDCCTVLSRTPQVTGSTSSRVGAVTVHIRIIHRGEQPVSVLLYSFEPADFYRVKEINHYFSLASEIHVLVVAPRPTASFNGNMVGNRV